MESNSLPGRVTASAAAAELLRQQVRGASGKGGATVGAGPARSTETEAATVAAAAVETWEAAAAAAAGAVLAW